jgi:hypothetical protein
MCLCVTLKYDTRLNYSLVLELGGVPILMQMKWICNELHHLDWNEIVIFLNLIIVIF